MALDFSSKGIARYRRVALQSARRACLGGQCAEDVAQDTVILLYRNRDRLLCDEAVNSWLRTTASRLAVRCAVEQCRYSPLFETLDGTGFEDCIAARIDRERALGRIERQMRKLTRVQRDLIRAIHLDGLSYLEAADRLGISVGSIGPTRSRALERLIVACTDDPVCVS